MKKLLLVILLYHISPLILAQGSVRGKVVDKETGEAIIGATVSIKRTNKAAITDLDGNFVINEVASGFVDVECNYLGYGTQRVLGLQVKDDRVALAYFKLQEGDVRELGVDVVVTAEAAKHLEAVLLAKRKKSSKFLETLSSEEIFRTGAENVAQAAKNLTGVTVEENKYAYVRGLGGRYVKILINGAELAQNILQEGGANLQFMAPIALDNITLYKNFAGDITGNFGGGALALNTRSIPERFTLMADLAIGFNAQSTFNPDFIGMKGGVVDFISYKDKSWELPQLTTLPKLGQKLTSAEQVAENQQNIDLMSKQYTFNANSATPNWKLSFAAGNQHLMGKQKRSKWGAYVAYTLRNTYEFYQNGITNRYGRLGNNQDSLVALNAFSDKKGEYASFSTFLMNFTFKIKTKHKLIISATADANIFRTARAQQGDFAEKNIRDQQQYFTRTLRLRQDNNQSVNFRGFHSLGSKDKGAKLDWSISATANQSFMPNSRYLSYSYNQDSIAPTNSSFRIDQQALPAEFYTELISILSNNWVNINVPIRLNDRIKTNYRAGVSFLYNTQSLDEQRYYYDNPSNTMQNNDLGSYFSKENYLSWNGNEPSSSGIFLTEGTLPQNNYSGEERVLAGYMIYDIESNKKLKLSAGMRYAYNAFTLTNTLVQDSLDIYRNFHQFFPFVNANYYLSPDMILRFAVTRTTARPRMRELLPFETFNFIGDYITVGNPNLLASDIHHLDIRWEMFPRLREVLAGGIFYKHIANPIALRAKTDQPNHYLQYVNENAAQVIGVELEARKNLDFIGTWAENFYVNANFAYIHSFSKIDASELAKAKAIDPNTAKYRPLVGQAPYVINIGLRYQNEVVGTLANVAFNLTGERLLYIMEDGLANAYEMPQPSLDIYVSQRIKEHWNITLRAENLLGSPRRVIQRYQGEEYIYQQNLTGQIFTLGVAYNIK